MRRLALKAQGFRHGRPCAGHPGREVYRKFKSIKPTGAEKRVEVLISTCRATEWIARHKAGHDAQSDVLTPYLNQWPFQFDWEPTLKRSLDRAIQIGGDLFA
jgi:hypothetical protein